MQFKSIAETKEVTLKNGSQELSSAAITYKMNLDMIQNSGITGICALYDLYHLARDSNHKLPHASKEILVSYNLVNKSGGMHNTIKNIVLSSLVEHQFGCIVQDPIAKEEHAVVASGDTTDIEG